jgi:predicted TPR repeat methyltransferase
MNEKIDDPEQRSLSNQQTLERALVHHNVGRLSEAENLYQQILQTDPNQPDALHLLGVISGQLGKIETSIEFLLKAIDIRPDWAEAHNNLGKAFYELGKWEESVAFCLKALNIRPDYANAHNNLGNAFRNLGRLEESLESYHNALEIEPDWDLVHSNIGNVLKDLGRLDESLTSYHRSLDINPERHDLHHLISSINGETTDIAPENYIRELFDDYAGRFDEHLTNTLDYKIPTLMRQVVDALPDGPATFPRVLDLGCGTGMVAEKFRDKAGEIDGIDLSPRMLEQARTKDVYANLYLGDVFEILAGSDVRPGGYELIVSADTFVYIGRLDGVFAATRQALTDNGLFVFSVEHLEDGDFKLLSSGRYSQNDVYVEKLAVENKFEIICCKPVVIRIEKDEPILGRIFVLRATV